MLSSDPKLPQISEQESKDGTVPVGFYRRFQERFYTLWRELARNDERLRARVDSGEFAQLVVGGEITEKVYTITDAAAFQIDPANGTIQLVTLGANRTPAATNFGAGQSVTLMVADGTAYTITWSTIGVTWVGGAAPTLATTGYTVIELWKVASTVYGAHVGNVA